MQFTSLRLEADDWLVSFRKISLENVWTAFVRILNRRDSRSLLRPLESSSINQVSV